MDMFKKGKCLYINNLLSTNPVSYSTNFFSHENYRQHRRGLWRPQTSRWRYPNGILLWLVVQLT
jgi:hypothetical protein